MKFVVCTNNSGFEASLEKRKIYQVKDQSNLPPGHIAIIDESGEDYIFEESLFSPIEISNELQEELIAS